MKKILIYFLLLISLKSHSQTLETDRVALVDLYTATNGNYWYNRSGWSVPGATGDNPCGWYGVSCQGGRVTSVMLGNNNLAGKIPESITTLTELRYLYIGSSSITGNIPTSIGNLTNLKQLVMGGNSELKGEIPVSIGNLHSLELLSITNTKISGNIPSELGTLTMLRDIGLNSNQLSGPIPGSLGNLSQLKTLGLNENLLSGNIPSELGNATSLTAITLGANQLSGSIPSSFGNLTQLEHLAVEQNNLSGPLPDLSGIPTSCTINIYGNRFTFDGMEPNIAYLDYYSPQKKFLLTNEGGLLRANVSGSAANNIYRWYKNGILVATNNVADVFSPTGDGTYRAEVTNSVATALTLVSEDYIVGSDNLESDRQALLSFYRETYGWSWTNQSGWSNPGNVGDSPCGWYGVSCTDGRVTSLSMNANNLNGTITPNIKNLKKLKILSLVSNSSLRGEIPSSLGEINELETLMIQSNNVSGILPSTLGNLLKLRWLDLSNNHLGGAIPPTIGNLTALEMLTLAQNEVGGGIPLEIGGLTNLNYFILYDNIVTGQIPAQLGNLSALRWFDLSVNQLTGHIPVELGNLTQLQGFNLNVNRLSGSIPTSLINATNLEIFSVGYNSLTGSIPSNIGNLTKLRVLAMASNQLNGSLPSSLGNVTTLEQVFLDHNNFTGAFPVGVENWNKITILRANHNQFDGVPSLTSIPVSAEVNFNNNILTFDSIEPNVSKIDQYFSQANIPITANGAILSVNAGGTIANNTYRWYKDNLLVATNSGTNTYTMTEYGKYSVQVSNSLAPSLTLVSDNYIYSAALPVRLINFTAKKSGETNLLRWATTTEIDNSGFEIERSLDARKFEKIGFMDGKGESKNLETYQFVDDHPLSVSYYRLRQIDLDGKFMYSRIVQVTSEDQELKLYPNPAKDIFTIESTGSGKSIDIYTLKGTRILEKPVLNSLTVSTVNWPAGTYIIRHGDISKKIVIMK